MNGLNMILVGNSDTSHKVVWDVGVVWYNGIETLRKGKNSGEAMPDKEKLYSGGMRL